MTRLFIANCSRQKQIIYYRLDVNSDGAKNDLRRFQPAKQTPAIPAGRQHPFGDLHMDQIKDIIAQLTPYGLTEQKDINVLPPRVIPYIYSLETPVQAEAIRVVDAHNTGILRFDGQRRREAAAIAAQSALANEASTINIPNSAFEATIEQEDAPVNDEKRVEEGYRIPDKESEVPDHIRRKRRA